MPSKVPSHVEFMHEYWMLDDFGKALPLSSSFVVKHLAIISGWCWWSQLNNSLLTMMLMIGKTFTFIINWSRLLTGHWLTWLHGNPLSGDDGLTVKIAPRCLAITLLRSSIKVMIITRRDGIFSCCTNYSENQSMIVLINVNLNLSILRSLLADSLFHDRLERQTIGE